MVDWNTLSTIIASVLVGVGAILGGLLTSRFRREKDTSKASIEEVAKALEQKRSETREKDLFIKELEGKLQTRLAEGAKAASELELELLRLQRASKAQGREEYQLIEKLFESYHQQGLRQSTIQFWFSAAASIVGFGLIIGLVLTSEGSALSILMRSFPGAIVEVVSALFFSQARETRKKATDLFDKLRMDKNQEKALEIAAGIEDRVLRSAIQAQIANASCRANRRIRSLEIQEKSSLKLNSPVRQIALPLLLHDGR